MRFATGWLNASDGARIGAPDRDAGLVRFQLCIASFSEHRFKIFRAHRSPSRIDDSRDAAVVNYGIKTGSRVRFDFEGNTLEGIVNRVTKRATVLVAHPEGERYSDGVRYVKFYIPVSALEPIG